MSVVSVDKLHRPTFLLRRVDRRSIDFLELVESIKEHGQIRAILVRPHPRKKGEFLVVDGWHTVQAVRAAGKKMVKYTCEELSDEDALVRTIAGNAINIETKPQDYAAALRRLLKKRPDLTLSKLSAILRKDRVWIGKILSLPDLSSACKRALNRGDLGMSNACELTRIKNPKYQDQLLEDAKVMRVADFRALVSNTIRNARAKSLVTKRKQYDEAERQSRPSLRKPKEVKAEMKDPIWGRLIVADEKITDPVVAWQRAMAYALNVDKYALIEREKDVTAKDLRKLSQAAKRKDMIAQKKTKKTK